MIFRIGHLRVARWLPGLVCALLMVGCGTVRNGGAPEPAFNYEKDLQDLEALFAPAASIQAMGTNPTPEARNAFIDGRIALYNIRYLRFVRDLGVDKQHLDAATDALLLGISLSSAAVGGARAKTNLALAAAGVTGAKITIDKHFYFDKTIPALVSTMNAQRKLVLLDILKGMGKSVADYPLTRTLEDLSNYEQAGTLIGAITVLQSDAAAKEKAADQEIRALEVPTVAESTEKKLLAAALRTLRTESSANLAKINQILTKRRGTPVDIKDFAEARLTLSNEFGNDALANLPLWRSAIEAAGITISTAD